MASATKARGATRNGSRAREESPWSWSAEEFFAEWERTSTIAGACAGVGIARSTAYRRRDRDPEFAERWAEVDEKTIEELERVAYERAVEGSDRLIEFLLKAKRPDVYRDRISIDDERERREREKLAGESDDELDARLVGVDNVERLDDHRKAS